MTLSHLSLALVKNRSRTLISSWNPDTLVMTFASILEEEKSNKLKILTGGKFCNLLHEAAISDVCSVPLLQCLRESLSTEPRMASNNLLEITDSPDGHQNNLRSASYEALMKIYEVLLPFSSKIDADNSNCKKCINRDTVTYKNTSDKIQFNDLQSLLHITLQNHQDEMTVSLLRIFQSTVGYGGCKRVIR
eukprot:bmy_18381T0